MIPDVSISELLGKAFRDPNAALRLYLMTSYLYYHCHKSVIEDHDYDSLCKYLLKNYSKVTIEHKKYVSEGDLRAGTGYALKEDEYPEIVKQAAFMLDRRFGKEDNERAWNDR